MGIACPMSPHGQRTIPQGIVLIFVLFPGFMVLPNDSRPTDNS